MVIAVVIDYYPCDKGYAKSGGREKGGPDPICGVFRKCLYPKYSGLLPDAVPSHMPQRQMEMSPQNHGSCGDVSGQPCSPAGLFCGLACKRARLPHARS